MDGGMYCIESCAEPAFSKLEPLNFTEVPLSLCPSAYAHARARAPTHTPTWADQSCLPRGKKSFPGSILYSRCCQGQLGRESETETPPLGTFIVSQSCGLAEAGWGACLHSLSWCGGHRDPPVLCLEFLRLRIFSLLSSSPLWAHPMPGSCRFGGVARKIHLLVTGIFQHTLRCHFHRPVRLAPTHPSALCVSCSFCRFYSLLILTRFGE